MYHTYIIYIRGQLMVLGIVSARSESEALSLQDLGTDLLPHDIAAYRVPPGEYLEITPAATLLPDHNRGIE